MGCEMSARIDGSVHWTDLEVDEAAFKDARLGRRFADLLKQFGDGMGGSIPFACQDWANTKAAYRFFSNAKVEEADILSGHFAAARARYDACEGPILLLQATTEFTYHSSRRAAPRSSARRRRARRPNGPSPSGQSPRWARGMSWSSYVWIGWRVRRAISSTCWPPSPR